jgi:hypothetical protein
VYPGPKRFPADHNSNFPYTKAVKTETRQGITKEKQHEAKRTWYNGSDETIRQERGTHAMKMIAQNAEKVQMAEEISSFQEGDSVTAQGVQGEGTGNREQP